MSRQYDSSSIQRAKNEIENAIQGIQNAQQKIAAIDLSALSGEARTAIEKQISSKTELLQKLRTDLVAAANTMSAKQNVLK